MRDNLKQILKLFFDLRIILLLILFFLLGVFMGRFIWEGERRDQITSGEVSPSPITSLEEVRNLDPEAKRDLLPVTYIVQPGDSSWRIAEAFYGDANLYPEIEKANGLTEDQDLEVGQELSIPRLEEASPEPEAESQLTRPEESETDTYIVQPNDSLWFIALKYLNDGTRWVEIYQHNRPLIGNDPNLIYPGQTLILPAE